LIDVVAVAGGGGDAVGAGAGSGVVAVVAVVDIVDVDVDVAVAVVDDEAALADTLAALTWTVYVVRVVIETSQDVFVFSVLNPAGVGAAVQVYFLLLVVLTLTYDLYQRNAHLLCLH